MSKHGTQDTKVEQLCNCWCSTQRTLAELLYSSITLRYDYPRQAPFSTHNISVAFFPISCGRKTPLLRSVWISWVLSLTSYSCCRHRGFGRKNLSTDGCTEDSGCSSSSDWCGSLCHAPLTRCHHQPALMVQMPNHSFSVSVKQDMTSQEKFSCSKIYSAQWDLKEWVKDFFESLEL